MQEQAVPHVAVIGGGPAGLFAAETARAGGARVTLFDHLPSVGRKILIAGKGGLNLTHSEPYARFVTRYRERSAEVARWLAQFDADALRAWARDLGIETIVGSSGRVFPQDLRAAPLLRGWVRRLHRQGVTFAMQHRWLGWDAGGALRLATSDGERRQIADATILALGGASWPRLGSDGGWVATLAERGVPIATLQPANCGFERGWSSTFIARHAGAPVKPVALAFADRAPLQGEFVITAHGVEGSLVYARAAELRDAIGRDGVATPRLDLCPNQSFDSLVAVLSKPRGKRSLSEHLRRTIGVDGVRLGLLHELGDRSTLADPHACARQLKSLPMPLERTRPIDEAISSAGGVRFDALDDTLMLRALPGVYCVGEMLDWEAPTGGYLLNACLASGRFAARAALARLGLDRGP